MPLPETAEEALSVLIEENRKRRYNRKVLAWTFGGGFALLIGLHLILWLVKGKAPDDIASMASMMGLIGAAAAFTPRHKAALRAAERFEDPRLVGFLLEARHTADAKDTLEACEAGLMRSLPKLEDPEMLDPYQRNLLYRLLNAKKSPALVELGLEAAVRTAGSEAIPALERFRTEAEKSENGEMRRLGARALQILPDLRIRKARAIIEERVGTAQRETDDQRARLKLGQ